MQSEKKTKEVSATEAARKLKTTYLRILMLIREGILEGGREDGNWYVTNDSLDSFSSKDAVLKPKTTCRTPCGGNCGGHGL